MKLVVPLEQFPGIDYFDQELVNLYNNAWHYVKDNWGQLPLDVQLLLHPYTNDVFGPVAIHNPVRAMHPFADWVSYQWFNRTGDRPGLVQMMCQIQEERDGKSCGAMAPIARYVNECNNAGYEDAFVHKADFYRQRAKAQTYWLATTQTLIGGDQDVAYFLLSESATADQAHSLYRHVFGKEKGRNSGARNFAYLVKGFEKYGMITEMRTAVLSRLYALLDSGVQDGYDALICIVLMIENVIGVHISEWRKQIDWLLPVVEAIGVSNIFVRGAPVGLTLSHGAGKWAVSVDCNKEYMVTMNAVGFPRKTFRTLYGNCVVPL